MRLSLPRVDFTRQFLPEKVGNFCRAPGAVCRIDRHFLPPEALRQALLRPPLPRFFPLPSFNYTASRQRPGGQRRRAP